MATINKLEPKEGEKANDHIAQKANTPEPEFLLIMTHTNQMNFQASRIPRNQVASQRSQ
jgi:hypothetical protein